MGYCDYYELGTLASSKAEMTTKDYQSPNSSPPCAERMQVGNKEHRSSQADSSQQFSPSTRSCMGLSLSLLGILCTGLGCE